MTCPRKGRLLRFQSNSTATPDGYAQKLGNSLWYDSELTATKNGQKPTKDLQWSCIDWTSLGFQFVFKFRVVTSLFPEVDELLNEHWAKIVPRDFF